MFDTALLSDSKSDSQRAFPQPGAIGVTSRCESITVLRISVARSGFNQDSSWSYLVRVCVVLSHAGGIGTVITMI